MKTIAIDLAEKLIDFAPTEESRRMGFAQSQLEGAVAAYNMLARNRIAYLADEVGMGKTYVALGVMGLIRHLNPAARIVVLAPRENIQLKWIKEFSNFIHLNWLVKDNRVMNLHGDPVRPAIACSGFDELARTIHMNDNRDLYLRNTTFSVSVRDADARKRCRTRIRPYVPWIPSHFLDARKNELEFRDSYGRVLNAIIPDIELLIVDEAHNFKHGFGPNVSNRNRILGLALGHPDGAVDESSWYRHRVKRILMLSATPFEYDYGDLYRQLDVFGFGKAHVADCQDRDKVPVRSLLGDGDAQKQEVAKRLLIRRVAYLNIAGTKRSKNQYRREWRHGGYRDHDLPMLLEDPRQRLIVGLVQKKVAEILGNAKFNNSFQIGMLSSFESFMESLSRSRRLQRREKTNEEQEDGEELRVFDGDQTVVPSERLGIDSYSLETVVRSYKQRFRCSLPHPKLDATADSLKCAFVSGEKSLVFVRRVATTGELKSKLDFFYDRWIQQKLFEGLPNPLHLQLKAIFDRYEREQAEGRRRRTQHSDDDDGESGLRYDEEEDEGDTDTFFAWFFRGEGPEGILSGAAFQKNRLRSFSSAYALMFEDDRIAWLLGHPDDPLATLADLLGANKAELSNSLRDEAWRYFRIRSKQKEGYPRLFVFESYQIAALRRLAALPNELGRRANVVLHERYEEIGLEHSEPPDGFPDADQSIGVQTLFTELAKRPHLRSRVWPEENKLDFQQMFRRRELRRELISAQVRLGHAFIDLYILAISILESFDLRSEGMVDNPVRRLIERFLDQLEVQSNEPGFSAFRELTSAADAFDVLVAVNFPEVRSAKLMEIATIFGRTLQHQLPVGRMHGTVNKRMVRQFRMPGYPLVLITTDVLQEGEDLHTFCKRVVHYGITWTPSAMEQRTGRVDRIGGLLQRQLDGRTTEAELDELIQVFYPHLEDTIERLQVCRVLERLNKFVRMVHKMAPSEVDGESRISIAKEILRINRPAPPVQGLLESAYPVADGSLGGELDEGAINYVNVEELAARFADLSRHIIEKLHVRSPVADSTLSFAGVISVSDGQFVPWNGDVPEWAGAQGFSLTLISQVGGGETLIRCTSPVGRADLNDHDYLNEFYDWQRRLKTARLCARLGEHHLSTMTIEMDRLFHLEATQPEEIEELVKTVVLQADRMKREIFADLRST